MQFELDENERLLILMSLWNSQLTRQQLPPPEDPDSFLGEAAIGDAHAQLVRKLGGDPTAPLFGLGTMPPDPDDGSN